MWELATQQKLGRVSVFRDMAEAERWLREERSCAESSQGLAGIRPDWP